MEQLLALISDPQTGHWLLFLGIVLATFILEDLTCVTVSMLIIKGQVEPVFGVFSCFVGIFLGDVGLWALGRYAGTRLLRWRPAQKRFSAKFIERMGVWFDRHAAKAILASRFLPGTRFAVYTSYGMLGKRPLLFIVWTFIACLLWTPLMITASVFAGMAVTSPFERLLGGGWFAMLAALVVIFLFIRTLMLVWTEEGRARIIVRVSKLWRWEFWPMWAFYPPLVPWLAWLSLKHGGVTVFTAANPGVPDGGVVGESKYQILSNLPPEWVVPTHVIQPSDPQSMTGDVKRFMEEQQWSFPVVLKPDASQRGAGFKVARSEQDVSDYFARISSTTLLQYYHPGPYEAGVFYYRIPGQSVGKIFSITDKKFNILVGDGHSTLKELIWAHPRYRMQARVFFARHADKLDRVLEKGERLTLALAGNHCQGTRFEDGERLITPQLEKTIDGIARQFKGFYFGRFDVRYHDEEDLKAGAGFTIIEANGVTSESTDIYDPHNSLFSAYKKLFRQCAIMYRIGAINIKRGIHPTPVGQLLRSIIAYYREREIVQLSD